MPVNDLRNYLAQCYLPFHKGFLKMEKPLKSREAPFHWWKFGILLQKVEGIVVQEILPSSSQVISCRWQPSLCSENRPAIWTICYMLPG